MKKTIFDVPFVQLQGMSVDRYMWEAHENLSNLHRDLILLKAELEIAKHNLIRADEPPTVCGLTVTQILELRDFYLRHNKDLPK